MSESVSLFDARREELTEKEAPLAARMRPRTLDEFVGQEHIIGPGRLLRRAIQADQLSSIIFYGPPGTGKTTLARIIANTTRAHFIAINAVLAGVKDIRAAIKEAQERRGRFGQRTILFVDEVHRFNKAQQDALLPWVENGTVILIGATTENPYFEVNKPLISRSRIFQLKPLTEDDLREIARRALADPERGYGKLKVHIDEDALDHLVNVANGDARALLNALELAVETTPPGPDGVIHIDMAVAEESIQRRAVLYDKEGDAHFDTISAFIKSLRGSDPDAALYWLARMVYAGEDPRFIFRRMLIFASEDVGLADPNAIQVVTACAQAFDYVGLPEGRFHLAQATIYLATAPKSNSTMGFFDALKVVEQEREAEVPAHLRDASRDAEGFGHGQGYLYPHAYRDHWVAQQYLPDALQGRVFYQPSDQGYEARIREEVARRREAQLAAMIDGGALGPPEVLTFTGDRVERDRERWLQRTIGDVGEHLAALRDRVMDAAGLQRHHLVLDLNAGSGLLTWEALRRVPEGGVWTLARTAREAEALRELAARLPEVERPIVMQGDLDELPELLAARGDADVRFDAVVGRNALTRHPDKPAALRRIATLLRPGGRLSLAEAIPRRAQRLYRLVPLDRLGSDLAERVIQAEEAIYADPDDPMVNWDASDLEAALEAAGLSDIRLEVVEQPTEVHITPALIERWFDSASKDRPSYGQRLAAHLSAEQIDEVRDLFARTLTGQTVAWVSVIAYVRAVLARG
ncbi:MAG: AAA family ATPase [Chloroflexi bacterium]|nr:AAA family ATPase [Chloroflexota bacterium]